MSPYIDGFVFPVKRSHLSKYRAIAEKVADIWREYGAISYCEYLCEDPRLAGTRSFEEVAGAAEGEVVIFGWVSFPSKAVRDAANKKVPQDPRMEALISPLIDPTDLIFQGDRMIYGGFEKFIDRP